MRVKKSDNNGNTLSDGNNVYRYDYENRLIEADTGTDIISYRYLPNGDRIIREKNGLSEFYLYDREDVMVAFNHYGEVVREYLHGPGIDEPVSVRFIGAGSHKYITNVQGSVIALVDSAGQFSAQYRYDAWGNLISSEGEMKEVNTYLYTGREYDWDTGIYYYRARSYNPEVGRFLQRDPAEMVDGPNMYVYCGGEPVNRVDPFGNFVGTRCGMVCVEYDVIWSWRVKWDGVKHCMGPTFPNYLFNLYYKAAQSCFLIGVIGFLITGQPVIFGGSLSVCITAKGLRNSATIFATCVVKNFESYIERHFCKRAVYMCGLVPIVWDPIPV